MLKDIVLAIQILVVKQNLENPLFVSTSTKVLALSMLVIEILFSSTFVTNVMLLWASLSIILKLSVETKEISEI